ncbi:polyamine aminopropyltransferase [Glycomyces xiaoerkulensis]|uniref:spermidine synthase n=1 Tax=Glycomyces xiaoerkulensis TaxID=2038139 RepID=UPI000C263ABE|nr:spermidine synthase [Glycomyces xiaoerkulensis]
MHAFEELDWQSTPMGEFSLRRRFDPVVKTDVYEVKLDDEFLMSSLFTAAETQLAELALARTPGDHFDVVVGGLGLGYTAVAALEDPRVETLTVVEYSEAVIEWHERELIPDTAGLAADPQVDLVHGDFFAAVTGPEGFFPDEPERRHDAILLDIDHAPRRVLHHSHSSFYGLGGMRAVAARLVPGGTFALWSDEPPEDEYTAVLEAVFTDVAAERIWFDNPLTGGRASNTVYLATNP